MDDCKLAINSEVLPRLVCVDWCKRENTAKVQVCKTSDLVQDEAKLSYTLEGSDQADKTG